MGQRTGTKLPTADEQALLQSLLSLPDIAATGSARGTGNPSAKPWDGENDARQRVALAAELITAFDAAARKNVAEVAWKEKAGSLPMTSLEGAAKAAKQVVDQAFSEWVRAAAMTELQRVMRATFCFTASGVSPTLIDVSDGQRRAEAGKPISPRDMVLYYGATDGACRAAMARHGFNSSARGNQSWFYDGIVASFTATNTSMLTTCDRFGYGMSDPATGRIFVSAAIKDWDPRQGEDVDAVRDFKWKKFKVFVHEYIHSQEHPVVPDATAQSNTIREGFCEYLTREVLRSLPGRPSDYLDKLTMLIEGRPRWRDYSELRKYQAAGNYATYVENVEAAVDIIGGVNGLLAIFLQGHVEFLGLDRNGSWESGIRLLPGGARCTVMPTVMRSLQDLASATGKAADKIIDDNPDDIADGLKGTQPWPSQVRLPGFHGHRVVVAADDDGHMSESWADIAAQHGVTVAALKKANPGVSDPEPVAWMLVPDNGAG